MLERELLGAVAQMSAGRISGRQRRCSQQGLAGLLDVAGANKQLAAGHVERVVAVEAVEVSTTARPASGPSTSATAMAWLSATTGLGSSPRRWSYSATMLGPGGHPVRWQRRKGR